MEGRRKREGRGKSEEEYESKRSRTKADSSRPASGDETSLGRKFDEGALEF